MVRFIADLNPPQKICTFANGITFIRLILTGIAYYVLLSDSNMVFAGILLAIAFLGDFFDGLVARFIEKRHPGKGVSKIGEILDPISDKFCLFIVVFINWKFGLLIIFFELIGIIFAGFIKKKLKKHYISFISKIITWLQAIILIPIFLTNLFLYIVYSYFQVLINENSFVIIMFLILALLSALRTTTYLIYFMRK